MTNPFPKPATSLATWNPPHNAKHVSIDFEFDARNRPSLVGLSAGGQCVSVVWDWKAAAKIKELAAKGLSFLGHNLIDADRPIIIEHANLVIPLDQCEDSIVQHMLANSYFQNIGNKRKGDDNDGDGDAKGIGMLDLWSFVSLYTDLPCWKRCRDGLRWGTRYPPPPVKCSGPCPLHNKVWYNAMDAYGPDIALPVLHGDLESKRIPRSLVSRVTEYCEVARKMRETGIRVDLEYRDGLNREFREERAKLFPRVTGHRPCGVCKRMSSPPCKVCRDKGREVNSDGQGLRDITGYAAPFEPGSPQQVAEYFRRKGIYLRSTAKDDIIKAIERTPENHPAYGWLQTTFAYKEIGKGLDSWLNEKYLNGEWLHPRTIPYGAASGRTAASRPNYQNFPKKKEGIFSKIRNCIVPVSSEHIMVGADYGQLEYRGMLWYSYVWLLGQKLKWAAVRDQKQLFDPMLPSFGDLLARAAAISGRSERDVLKTVVYAALYNEGIQVKEGNDLASKFTKAAIAAGALVVHKDWEYGDGLVCYTGVNLADRLFGGHSFPQRKLALDIQERFFSLPGGTEIRLLHREISKRAETGSVSSHTGRYLKLTGPGGDRIKDASAHLGQGLTDYVQEAIIKYHRGGEVPYMMIHDELIFNRPKGHTNKQHREFMATMGEPSKLFEGFVAPIETKVGERWGEMEKLQ